MEEIWQFILAHQIETLLLGFGAVVVAFVITHWQDVKFWWLNFTYNFPVIGKLSILAKDIEGIDEGHKWFYSEERLCRDYYNFYEKVDVSDESYDEAKDYLHAVGELGRKPTPTFIWAVIIFLVIVEAFGFAYVLAGFTVPGASESMQVKAGWVLALLVAAALVFLVHFSGRELHKNLLIKKIRRWYKNDNAGGTNWRDLKPDAETITIDNTFDDKESPDYIRMLNRLDVNDRVATSYKMTLATVVVIAVIAVTTLYIRHQVLVQDIASSHQSSVSIFDGDASPFGDTGAEEDSDVGALFGDSGSDDAKEDLGALFGDDTKASADASERARPSIEDETKQKGGDATFVMLTILFLAIQIVGLAFGFSYGFSGRESREAYELLHGFSTKKAFLSYYERAKNHIARVAQKQLQKLQHKMNIINDEIGTDAETTILLRNNKERTFSKYLEFEDK